jgi:hypothetical protein
VFAAPADDLVDPCCTRRRLVGPAREHGADHDREGRECRLPVAQPQLGAVQLPGRAAGEVEDARGDDHVVGVGAVSAGVHPYRAANRSRDADEELEATDPGRRRPARQYRERYPAARVHARRGTVDVELLELAGK